MVFLLTSWWRSRLRLGCSTALLVVNIRGLSRYGKQAIPWILPRHQVIGLLRQIATNWDVFTNKGHVLHVR